MNELPLNKIIHGDCLEVLKTLPENSADSICCDPPYELGFMGKSWDNTGIANNVEMWKECLRVLKPGGHLLAFSGTRTYHRMAVAIEDAGFEVRDMIEWVYGSGFPKSLNIGKAVDKLLGNEREVVGEHKARVINGGAGKTAAEPNSEIEYTQLKSTKGTSEWEGWGTALKPAHEPICMARKPLAEKSVALNVLKYGTGGINIDENRVEAYDGTTTARKPSEVKDTQTAFGRGYEMGGNGSSIGRFPANLITDGSEEVRECFPETKSTGGLTKNVPDSASVYGKYGVVETMKPTDSGNASRFFKGIPQVVDLYDFSIYNRSILTNIKQLCGQHLTKKKTDITLDGVIQEVEKFIQDAELLMSGNSTTIEKFLTDTASITKTLIAQMTELKTLNVLPNWLITKFTEESEQTIKSLRELTTEDVKSAKSIFLLQTFTSEVLESIRDIVKIVVEQDSNSGEYKSLLYQAKASKSERNKGCEELEEKDATKMDGGKFESASTTATERTAKNNHPTVKPIALMEYLIKMVTPKGGVVLDPFAGSFSTGVACVKNGFGFVGIEREEEYVVIGKARLEQAQKERGEHLKQTGLF